MGDRVIKEDSGKVILKLAIEGLSMMKDRSGRMSMKK